MSSIEMHPGPRSRAESVRSARLDPAYRAAALRRLERAELDMLVIGGGVVGAGAALDAASRGLSVALVEAQDWASGTSSRSSKLIHGGLRYLEQRDFGLVREALRERSLLLHRLAPHLVRPVPFLFPLTHRVWQRLYVGAGVFLYDTIGGAKAVPRHRHLSRRKMLELGPSLRPDSLVGAIRYYDAQVDDARFTMTLGRTAAQHGATVLTRAKVVALLREDARVVGARVRDVETGQELSVRARRVISAVGIWTDEIHDMAKPPSPFRVRTSKGVHIVVPRERLQLGAGIILPTEKSVLFVIPWERHWIIGTTDTPWDLEKTEPAASGADIDYLLDHANVLFREPLTADDIVGVYAGLRPLLVRTPDDPGETTRLSREHAVAEAEPRLFIVAGGKLTTYRVMAADVVDAAAAGIRRDVPASATEDLPLLGATGYHEACAAAPELAERVGLPAGEVERLLDRYGSAVVDIVDLIDQDADLGQPIPGGEPYLKAEAAYAVTHEGALHLDDILVRRTRISMETADRGLAAAVHVAAVIAPRLGWSESTAHNELNRYRRQVKAQLAALDAPDDQAADAARHAALDAAG